MMKARLDSYRGSTADGVRGVSLCGIVSPVFLRQEHLNDTFAISTRDVYSCHGIFVPSGSISPLCMVHGGNWNQDCDSMYRRRQCFSSPWSSSATTAFRIRRRTREIMTCEDSLVLGRWILVSSLCFSNTRCFSMQDSQPESRRTFAVSLYVMIYGMS